MPTNIIDYLQIFSVSIIKSLYQCGTESRINQVKTCQHV